MILKPLDAVDAALKGGFYFGGGLISALAVAYAESSWNTDAKFVNTDTWSSIDRGWFQINDHWHPEVTDAMANDPVLADVARAIEGLLGPPPR
jgi:hypothetical protein